MIAGLLFLLRNLASAEDLKLTLPPAIYTVAGIESSIYHDNIVLTQTPEKYTFRFQSPFGKVESRRWLLSPEEGDVGSHMLSVTVQNDSGETLATASTRVIVTSHDAGESLSKTMKLLIIGDSLTNATRYPNEIARRLTQPGNPQWKMFGTNRPGSALEGVGHEGYGGWTWERFVTKYEPEPDGTNRKRSSPFVFLNDESKPTLDLPRYFREECAGDLPDYVIIKLGINDCFGAPPDDPAGMDARIDKMFTFANQLLQAVRHAAPDAMIGVCLTTPPNSRQKAFEANYKDRYTRWGWKRIQHRLVERQIAYVAGLKDPHITFVPTELDLDPIDGYPVNNGVHPNGVGYQQIGTSVYCWLKYQFSVRDQD